MPSNLLPEKVISHTNFVNCCRYFSVHIIAAYLFAQMLYTHSLTVIFFGAVATFFVLKLPHPSVKSAALSYTLFFTAFLWFSSYWLVYCLLSFVDLPLLASICILSLGFLLLSLLFTLPVLAYRWQHHKLRFGFSLALFMVIAEYLRIQSPFALPWLLSGHMGVPITLLSKLYPVGGVFLVGYLLLRCSEVLVNVLLLRYDADARLLLPSLLAFSLLLFFNVIPNQHSVHAVSESQSPGITVRLIQANHNHMNPRVDFLDWQDYMHSITIAPNHVLNVTAEGAISLHHQQLTLSKFRQYPILKNSFIGLNFHKEKGFSPMLVSTNSAHGSYQKQHLVPFGEYLPLPRALLQWLSFYQTHANAQPSSQSVTETMTYQDFHFFPMICYDLFFPTFANQALARADAIVAVAENTWYRESIFHQLFLRAASVRALETQRPVLLTLNRGPSTYLLESGQIAQQIPPYQPGVLTVSLTKNPSKAQPLYQYLSDFWIIAAICFFEICARIYAHYLHPQTKVKKCLQ